MSASCAFRKESFHGALCSKCKTEPALPYHAYCRGCRNGYMRDHRPRHSELHPEARRRSIARSYANVYQSRGLLTQMPCELCGHSKTQKHHPDYSKPLEVRWLCQSCHLDLHRKEPNA